MFANAGIGKLAGAFSQMDTQAYRDVLAVNLDGVFFTLRAAARHMVERAKPAIPAGRSLALPASPRLRVPPATSITPPPKAL